MQAARPTHLSPQSPVHVIRGVHRPVVERHAVDCAFLWVLRDQAVKAPHYRMRNLLSLDRRIEANREGLVHAGDAGWAACLAELAQDEADAGATFAAALVAFSTRRADHMRHICQLAVATPGGQRALISALGWLPFEPIAPMLQRLAAGSEPRLRRVALRVLAIHRRDPFDALKQALTTDDPDLLQAAVRGLGESGRQDALPFLRARLDDAAAPVRATTAASLLMLGDAAGLPWLEQEVMEAGPAATPALELVLRSVSPAEGRQLLSRLSGRPGSERMVIAGTGMLGDPLAIPWLISRMQDPPLARLAGEAFSMITGADLEYLDLDLDLDLDLSRDADAPVPVDERKDEHEGPDDDVLPQDRHLPLPDPAGVQAWWAQHEASMAKGIRHLCGRPVTPASLLEILRTGYQRQRRAAALQWALMDPDRPFFDVRQRSDAQQRALQSCN